MEKNLLESRLNKVLKECKFGENGFPHNQLDESLGLFINEFYVMLDVKIEEKAMPEFLKQTNLVNSPLFKDINKSEKSISIATLSLWAMDLSAASYINSNDDAICRQIGLKFFMPSIFQSKATEDKQNAIAQLPFDKSHGERAFKLTASPVNPNWIAVHSEKQIFVANLQSALGDLKNATSLLMQRMQVHLSTPELKIASLKFHKQSQHHLGVLMDDGYFSVYNLNSSFVYHEVQINLIEAARQNKDEYHQRLVKSSQSTSSESNSGLPCEDQKELFSTVFVDFEFGGNSRTNSKQTIDFDAFAVYFLAANGAIFYQTPLILTGMPILAETFYSLEAYLSQEIEQITEYEHDTVKVIVLKEFLKLLKLMEESCEMEFEGGSKVFSGRLQRLVSTISLNDLMKEHALTFRLQRIEVAASAATKNKSQQQAGTTALPKQNSEQSKQLLGCSQLSGGASESQLMASSRAYLWNQHQLRHSNTIERAYRHLHKVECAGETAHIFILTKQSGKEKSYSTVATRFSTLPVMPTHLKQTSFTFALIRGEKAHLEYPTVNSQLLAAVTSKKSNLPNAVVGEKVCARLVSMKVEGNSLDSVTFAVRNRVYCINYAALQGLTESARKLYESSIRVLIDSKDEYQSEVEIVAGAFYACAVSESRVLLSVIRSNSSFKLRSFSLEYLSNYMEVSLSGKVLCEQLSKLKEATNPSQTAGTSAGGIAIGGTAGIGTTAPKNPMMTSSVVERPLQENKKVMAEKIEKDKLDNFEAFNKDMESYISEHEKVVQENVQLITERHSEMIKKSAEMQSKKEKLQVLLKETVEKNHASLNESKDQILKKDSEIQAKLSQISFMISKLKDRQAVGVTGIPGLRQQTVVVGGGSASLFTGGSLIPGAVNSSVRSAGEADEKLYDASKEIYQKYQNYLASRTELMQVLSNPEVQDLKIVVEEPLQSQLLAAREALKRQTKNIDLNV